MSNITQKWVKAIEAFSLDYTSKLSASEISRIMKIPQQTVSRILNEMVELNLIRFKRQGRNKLFYLEKNEKTNLIIRIIESQKALEFLNKNKEEALIINDLLEKFDNVIVFGSYASGKNKKDSDLDILILSNKKNILKIKSKYNIEINEHFVNKFDKNNPLVKEVISNHILFGKIDKIIGKLI